MGKSSSLERETDSRPKSALPDLSFGDKQNQITNQIAKKPSPPVQPTSFFDQSLKNSLTGPSPVNHSPPHDIPEGNPARRSVSFNDKTDSQGNKKPKELTKKEKEKQQKALDKKNKQKMKKQSSKVPV